MVDQAPYTIHTRRLLRLAAAQTGLSISHAPAPIT